VSIDRIVAGPNPQEARLVQAHLRLVKRIAVEVARAFPVADLDDLISHGQEGLLAGIRSFDPDRGLEIESWVAWRIRHEILDHLQKLTSMSRTVARNLPASFTAADAEARKLRAMMAAADASLSYVANVTLPHGAAPADGARHFDRGTEALVKATVAALVAREDAETGASPEEAYLTAEMKASMKKAISMLDERLRRFIDAYFYRELTLKEAGTELGVSEPTAWRMLSAAKEAIIQALKDIGFL
jgi:RNA polymerase sigma factor for flagellar operon FliA